jgi:ornithine decarboxylase
MIQKIHQKFDVNQLPKPAMIIDSSLIKEKFLSLQNLIDGVNVFYSVKTNPHIEILRLLNSLGSGFEIASLQELKDLINLGIPANKIISGNTLKTPEFIEEAYKYGVNYFAFDSEYEIDKLAELAPGANVSLRLTVDNTGSEWPLSKKFGAPISKSLDLLKYAQEKGLNPCGLTFHVGSQCMNPLAWSNALMNIAEVYFLAKRNDIKISVINLGGGFPSKLTKDIPKIELIKDNINNILKQTFSQEDLKFYIEPGRGIVGEAAVIISKVIARASRGSEEWLILDVGVYNGLLEAVAGIQYEIVSHHELNNINHIDDMVAYNIGGPTCDSWDTITKNYFLPKDLKIGDIVYILNTGAYTISETTRFNGFDPPRVYLM